MIRAHSLVAAAWFALAPPIWAGVWVVDEFGGGDFLRIQPAVNAASDGDTILVKTGSYPGFEVIDKALTITAELAATVDVEGSARVFDLSASKTVVLAGLACVGVSGEGLNEYGFYAEDCAGSVRVERCTFLGADGTTGHRDGTDGARAVRCVDVAFSAIDSTGGRGLYAYWEGGPPPDPRGNGGMGLLVLDSTVSVFHATLNGGDGVEPSSPSNYLDSGGHGGDGLRVMSPTIPASATTLIGSECTGGNGADGGPSDGLLPSWGGDGGNGIRVESGLARVLGALASGGVAGWGWLHFGMTHFVATDGAHGLARAGDPGDFEDIAGSARELTAGSPVREGETLDLTFTGVPGDRVTLLVGLDARAQEYLPAWHATRLVQAPGSKAKSIRPIGVIPASGTLDVSLPVFDLGYGALARTLHLQALFRTSSNDIFASNAAMPVELDAAY
ncbi:MAG: hypothetical protein ACKVWV_09720 [Planctomycetota bacterium]